MQGRGNTLTLNGVGKELTERGGLVDMAVALCLYLPATLGLLS